MELKYKSWSEVTIAKYYQLEEISEDKSLEGEAKDMEILAALCECTSEDISRLPYQEYLALKGQISWLGTFSFDTEHDPRKIDIGDRKYKVEGNDMSKFSTAQYIDFQTFYNKGDLKQYYGNVLATFLIPEDKKEYNVDYDVVEEAKYIYENLDICRANQLMFFFRKKCHNSMIVTVNYLRFLAERNLKRKKLPEEEREMWKKILDKTQGLPGWGALIP